MYRPLHKIELNQLLIRYREFCSLITRNSLQRDFWKKANVKLILAPKLVQQKPDFQFYFNFLFVPNFSLETGDDDNDACDDDNDACDKNGSFQKSSFYWRDFLKRVFCRQIKIFHFFQALHFLPKWPDATKPNPLHVFFLLFKVRSRENDKLV